MKKVSVLIVDDSAFMRRILSDILKKDHRIEVVGTARNGKDCLEKIHTLNPDVITLDIEMPVMDGLEALSIIMENHPRPVVMVSSLTKEGAESTVKAVSLGAVDFIQKPSGSISLDMKTVEQDVVRKVLVAGEANVNVHKGKPVGEKVSVPDGVRNQGNLVAIGTSTGGPRALQQVLTTLPGNLPAPIVIVQHMPEGFTKSLSERLNRLSEITIKEGEHMEELQNGIAYIAPGGSHMQVIQGEGGLFIHLDKTAPINGHRPSVNRLLQSLSHLNNVSITSVIMTGMGADGLEGLIELKHRMVQTYSIAESKESCVVYGMPKAVVKSGLADKVLELEQISQSIVQSLHIRRR
ncbi:two-component system, chemotaxis family, response regulator CheB [Halobacillus dabanensis]|uniref:Protein-glutamate methylesterase/protein-glutamine glutaminase n=1 Tax=Halobacillus dabanensis TaxID=240302 RepID=A0A1I3Y5U4_HALDA|nr:chemotaxis response regulator protein-glutamate methylesterase [Halobacillus dabanensis]SFK27218.1 two-component system, chemotaxis family, response regulator CheB [Halobacillus dabanensis]